MTLTKKQKQHRKILLGIVLIVGAIFLINFLGGGGKIFAVEQGFSALSIQDVDYDNGTHKILVTGVLTGAEELVITPTDMNKYLVEEGVEATQTITGSFKLTNQQEEYTVARAGKYFKRLAYKRGGILLNCQKPENIPSGYIFEGKLVTSSSVNKIVCIYSTQQGESAGFTGNQKDLTTLSINIGGATGTFKPYEGKFIDLSDGSHIEFKGSLNSIDKLTYPSPDLYSIIYIAGKYGLISGGAYDSYTREITAVPTCGGFGGRRLDDAGTVFIDVATLKTAEKVITCINDFNVKMGSVLTDKLSSYGLTIQGEGETPSFTPTALRVNLVKPTSYPVITIKLDASKVAIRELKGKPEISSEQCVPDKEVFSGDTYNSQVVVKNTGKSGGEFSGKVICTGDVTGYVGSGFVEKDSQISLPVNVGGRNTISGTTSSSKCTITIDDTKGGGTATCSFNLGIKYLGGNQCEPKEIKCIDSQVLRNCNSDGTNFVDTKCDAGCVVLAGNDECASTTACVQNSDCKTGQECVQGFCKQKTECIPESQTIVKDQECCAGLEKQKTGFFLFRFLKSEGTCEKTLPKCEDADAFLRSKILGGIFEKLKCDGSLLQKINPLAYIKLILVPIVFLFELLFTPAMLGRWFKRRKGFAWLIGFILAGIVAYVLYTAFLIGLIFVGILFFFQITAGVISLFKKR